ncbi:MAG: acetyl-CoA carboxylase carboxyltransferase subunit alpha [Gammaproteobacteria bacterium]|uniref:Acetyl-coenzyme A carboxylase carboxyl transferase subunit alpha n=1 Tax=SAR86 cluster bacterium TaxID=2030880 RepID=A0A368C7S1_9GAMM|nr:MAG: acetyl-CoA carboxylase carboxyltransferase subunit alpha [SAR86 cluster bacterium]|tara:strand:+ start:334 stop:1278 length:945 start_codon:yes stop_codon:yes gene_type:complete
MNNSFLDFERPIAEINDKIQALKDIVDESPELLPQIAKLTEEEKKITQKIYSKLSTWQIVQVARHPRRPHTADYISRIFSDFDELHGDRMFGDDSSIIGGIGNLDDNPVVVIGHEKGRDTEEKVKRNFGMPQPEGYRKAKRLMKLAEQFYLPVITFIDTSGAYPGIEGEERGQSEAIASNLAMMSELQTPILVVITGEGGSGGALALGIGDHVSMLEYATYSVASPEACSSIVWRSANFASEAADAMKVCAKELIKINVINEIINEPLGGAHRDYDLAAKNIKSNLITNLKKLNGFKLDSLLDRRYERLIEIGK